MGRTRRLPSHGSALAGAGLAALLMAAGVTQSAAADVGWTPPGAASGPADDARATGRPERPGPLGATPSGTQWTGRPTGHPGGGTDAPGGIGSGPSDARCPRGTGSGRGSALLRPAAGGPTGSRFGVRPRPPVGTDPGGYDGVGVRSAADGGPDEPDDGSEPAEDAPDGAPRPAAVTGGGDGDGDSDGDEDGGGAHADR